MKVYLHVYGTAKGILILIVCVICCSSCLNILGEAEDKTECLIVTPDSNKIEIRKVLSGATSPNYMLVLFDDSVIERVKVDDPKIIKVHINNDSIVVAYAENKYLDELGEEKYFRCKLHSVSEGSSFNFHYVNESQEQNGK